MDSVGSDGEGYFPQMEKIPPHNHDGVGGMHVYVPWWKYDRQNDFPRGYHIEMGGGRDMPGVGMFHDLCDEEEGYGVSLKQTCRKMYGCFMGFSGRGEMIANPDSYCDIDPDVVDQWGIPVLRFHFKWSDHELKMAKDMQEHSARSRKRLAVRTLREGARATIPTESRTAVSSSMKSGRHAWERIRRRRCLTDIARRTT